MELNLSGKIALVCGSTQGIGKAAATALASLGAKVVLMARNIESLETVAHELPMQSSGHEWIQADFSNHNIVEAKLSAYLKDSGNTIQILVNNTGGPPGGKIIDAKSIEFLSAFESHLLCNHVISGLVLPGMKKTGYGRIINVISTSVKIPLSGLGVSNTIRGAVANWAKTLANETAKFGITVNNVLPGATDTGRLQSLLKSKAQKGQTEPEIELALMASHIPMGRIGKPEEVAAAIAFLASPAASYITGINLPVDGGRTGSL